MKIRNGFTLIELLAAIVILAVVIAIAVPTVSNLIEGSRANAFKIGANQILKAIEQKNASVEEYDVSTVTVENMQSEIGISNENYNYLEVSMDEKGIISLYLEGKNKWDGLIIRGTKNNLTDEQVEATIYTYDYTGKEQLFTAPYTGIYKIELWGAAGGGDVDPAVGSHAGLGGYTKGQIYLKKGQQLYVYVGGKGVYGGSGSALGGYNGGGNGGTGSGQGGGGGATDIRLVNGSWDNQQSLYSRIMVAGAGGGPDNAGGTPGGSDDGSGGYAGGLIGENAKINGSYVANTGGTQTLGMLGKGEAATAATDTGGAGGGYRGGFATNNNQGGAGGGSSFISGYPGCDAIDESGAHTGQPIHYSNYQFDNYVMIDGASTMPNTSGATETGHAGNGYAIITGPVSD
ncbi:MAG: glycine-rich protein [Bacilli bacterium]|nr:glycine-rich protein [Bacilli bacterium]MDD3304787.1 glycine-rich protein [Bacilli bacterium]MDD4053809.1 glycine-rich protein [Bacilli bacterium]MDD4411617.1 glycine-rich protein [Bacilli bacterium]